MPREIYPSSYECDCGGRLDFSESTVREMKRMSQWNRVSLGGDGRHVVIFNAGEMVAMYCPKAKAELPVRAQSAEEGGEPGKPSFTRRQGQYLAFIANYAKLNGRPPAEADMALHFRISAPSVHRMMLTLAGKRLIERTPGAVRSLVLRVDASELPALE